MLGFILKVTRIIVRRAPNMTESTLSVLDSAREEIVPPPRRRHDQTLQVNAVQVIRIRGLLPLAVSVVAFALVSPRRLPSSTRKRGHPRIYSDASVLLIALLAAWSKGDADAAWSFPSSFHGYVFGYKVHVLLDRAACLPLFFLLSPANKSDLPFANPLLWLGRLV